MSETTDRAALPLEVKHYFEANEYLGFNPAWGVDLVGRLAAALADAERDLAKAWREGLAAGMKFSQSTNGNYAKNREAFLVNPYTPNA